MIIAQTGERLFLPLKDPVRERITAPPNGRKSLDSHSLLWAFGKPLNVVLFRAFSDGVFRSPLYSV
jgi:hypothetical protein